MSYEMVVANHISMQVSKELLKKYLYCMPYNYASGRSRIEPPIELAGQSVVLFFNNL